MNKVQHLHIPKGNKSRKRAGNWFRTEFLDDIKGMSEFNQESSEIDKKGNKQND